MRTTLVIVLTCVSALAGTPLTDIDGNTHDQLDASSKLANVLYFITNDCPISNQYAPEINRICDEYAAKNVGCYLVYIDPTLSKETIREHAADYSHDCCAVIHDTAHALVKRIDAKVTPEAAFVSADGEVLYQGRINNFYAALGKPRRFVTVHDLRDAIEATLAGKSVESPKTQALGCFIPDLAIYKTIEKHEHHHK